MLIDPPYELKEDYDLVVKAIEEGYKRFATGTYAILVSSGSTPTNKTHF